MHILQDSLSFWLGSGGLVALVVGSVAIFLVYLEFNVEAGYVKSLGGTFFLFSNEVFTGRARHNC